MKGLVLGALLAIATPAFAQGTKSEPPKSDPPQRITTSWGYVELANNEVSVVSTVDDPPKVRLASPTGALGGLSFNRLREDGDQVELILVIGKQDERFTCYPVNNSGQIDVFIRDGSVADGDKAMVKVALLRHDKVWFLGQGPEPNDPACEPPAPQP